jgi:hypothetical protein
MQRTKKNRSAFKTPTFKTPHINISYRNSVSIPDSKKGLRNRLYNKATKRLSKLYTNVGFLLYSEDERKLYEAKQEHGNAYLIQLFPDNIKLVLQEFETMSQDTFNELFNAFNQHYKKKYPDIKMIRDLREMSLRNKRYKKNMDDPSTSDTMKQQFTELYDAGIVELNHLNDTFAKNIIQIHKKQQNKESAYRVFFKGTRKNGSLLFPEQSGIGRRPLSKIRNFLGK